MLYSTPDHVCALTPLDCPCLPHYFFPLPTHGVSSCLHFEEQPCVCSRGLLHHTCLFKPQNDAGDKAFRVSADCPDIACGCQQHRTPSTSPRPFSLFSLTLCPFLSRSSLTGEILSIGYNSYKHCRALNTPSAPQLSPVDNTR